MFPTRRGSRFGVTTIAEGGAHYGVATVRRGGCDCVRCGGVSFLATSVTRGGRLPTGRSVRCRSPSKEGRT